MCSCIKLFVGLLLWIFILIPLLALPVTILLVWRLLSYITVLWKWRGREKPRSLNLLDSFFSLPVGAPYICWAAKLDGKVDLTGFKQYFTDVFKIGEKRQENTVLYQKVVDVLGFPYKTRFEAIDLSKHVIERFLTSVEEDDLPQSCFEGIQDLSQIEGDDVPKWQISLLQGKARTVVVFKMHHILGDGMVGRAVMDQLYTGEWKPEEVRNPPNPSFLQKLQLFLLFPFTMKETMSYFRPTKNVKQPLPVQPFSEGESKHVVVSWGSISFRKVRDLAKRTGTGVTSVLLSLEAMALKGLFEERGYKGGWGKPVTIALQRLTWDHPQLKGRPCNHHSMAFYVVPLLDGQSCLEQLKAVDKSVKEFDALGLTPTLPVLYSLFMDYIVPSMRLLNPKPKKITDGFLGQTNPCVFSEREYTLLGKKVEGVHFVAFPDEPETFQDMFDSFLLFTPITRGDVVDFSVHTTNDILRNSVDAKRFASLVQDSLRKLEEEVE